MMLPLPPLGAVFENKPPGLFPSGVFVFKDRGLFPSGVFVFKDRFSLGSRSLFRGNGRTCFLSISESLPLLLAGRVLFRRGGM